MVRHTLLAAAEVGTGQWYRLHPLTPVLQGGVVVAALVTAALASLWEAIILPAVLVFFGVEDTVPNSRLWGLVQQSLGLIALAALAFVVIIVLVFWLQWRVHVVRMDGDVIEVKKGLVAKSSRRARLDRVNTIGVRRPLIPRLLGLAKLDIQAAGNDASLVLAYLPIRVAQDLRRLILEGFDEESEEHAEEVSHREVEVPLVRYLASLLVSVETLFLLVVLSSVIITAVVVGETAVWLGVVFALSVYLIYLIERMIRSGNFAVDSLSGDLRVSVGLLSTSVETIPPQRIHTLELSQPWPWKLLGWWRLNANLASQPGAATNKAPEHTVILPVATIDEVLRIVQLGIPWTTDSATTELLQGMLLKPRSQWAPLHALLCPPRARWRIPFSAHVNAAVLQSGIVLMRRGVWVARISVTPLTRVQSSSLSIGPWHRALGLAQVDLHSVSGPVSLSVVGMDDAEARGWWGLLNEATQKAIDSPGTPSLREVAS